MAHTRKAMLLVHNIGIMFVIMADKITGNNDVIRFEMMVNN